eukprot:COSAG05_NODE_2237_length_3355_cov_2.365172_1_plen_1019_part_10
MSLRAAPVAALVAALAAVNNNQAQSQEHVLYSLTVEMEDLTSPAMLAKGYAGCHGSWQLLNQEQTPAQFFACSFPGCELLSPDSGNQRHWDTREKSASTHHLREGNYAMELRAYDCVLSSYAWERLRNWTSSCDVNCTQPGARGRSFASVSTHFADGQRFDGTYFPKLRVIGNGDHKGSPVDLTNRIAEGKASWEPRRVDLVLGNVDLGIGGIGHEFFAVPLSNSSSSLPDQCWMDSETSCFSITSPRNCDPVWKGCSNHPDGASCSAPGDGCNPNEPASHEHGCSNTTAKTCPHRCSEECKSALSRVDPNPPGCRECTHGEQQMFERGEVAFACGSGSDRDPACDAGYCGLGTCPAGSFCPFNFQCKMPCDPPNTETSTSYYCPTGVPSGRLCQVGLTMVGFPSGHSQCPGSTTRTKCPARSVCPDSSSQNACPKGFYCEEGKQKAKCFFWASCPEGTANVALVEQPVIVGLLFLAVVLCGGWLCGSVCNCHHRYAARKADKKHTQELLDRATAASKLAMEGAAGGRSSSPSSGFEAMTLTRTASNAVDEVSRAFLYTLQKATGNDSHHRGAGGLDALVPLRAEDSYIVKSFANKLRKRRNSFDERYEALHGDITDMFDDSPIYRADRHATSSGSEPPTLSSPVPSPSAGRPRPAGSGLLLSEGGGVERSDPHMGGLDVELKLPGATTKPRAPITIAFTDLALTLKPPLPNKKILRGVTGVLKSGRLTAIMGPSGAGKTSFLNAVSGKAGAYGKLSGQLLINGVKEPHGIQSYRKAVGFVPQEDIMLRTMTPKEILTFYARLRLPPGTAQSEVSRVVMNTLDTLDLWKIRHSRVGDEESRGISGGQRKRVNIGMELVAKPSVLFLDEPTSGLDSTSSLEVCAALRHLADDGINVAAVLHQPRFEIFEMFHDVLLLGTGGITVYLGPAKRAIEYFAALGYEAPPRTNPADFMMDVISGLGYGVPDQRTAEEHTELLRREWDERRCEWGSGDEHAMRASMSSSELARTISDSSEGLSNPK